MSADIINANFPKKASVQASVNDVLSDADLQSLDSILVCGFDANGELFVRAGNIDLPTSYFLSGLTSQYILDKSRGN